MDFIVTTSAKGQIVIPTAIRKSIGLESGQKVHVALRNGEVVVRPLPKNPVSALTGLCKANSSLTEVLLRERKDTHELEAKKFARFIRDADVIESRTRLRNDTALSK